MEGGGLVGRLERGLRAFHGSPHQFDRFDISKIGTGEGINAYGRGLYFAENEGVAQQYRDALALKGAEFRGLPIRAYPPGNVHEDDGAFLRHYLSGYPGIDAAIDATKQDVARFRGEGFDIGAREAENAVARMERLRGEVVVPRGHMYEVNLGVDQNNLLDWDTPLSKQPHGDAVRRILRDVAGRRRVDPSAQHQLGEAMEAITLYGKRWPTIASGEPQVLRGHATERFLNAGIPGLQYLDAGSRAGGDGTRNYVLFDDAPIEILRRYAEGGVVEEDHEAGLVDHVPMEGGGLVGRLERGIRAFHGSPHKFDRFSTEHIGRGEGVQAYGRGLYFADKEEVARNYRDKLSGQTVIGYGRKPIDLTRPDHLAADAFEKYGSRDDAVQSLAGLNTSEALRAIKILQSDRPLLRRRVDPGSMYEVRLNLDPSTLLDWDKPLHRQSDSVQQLFQSGPLASARDLVAHYRSPDELTGGILYQGAGQRRAWDTQGWVTPESADALAADALLKNGVPGVQYLDRLSRGAREGSHNYVTFSDEPVEILRRYAEGGVVEEDHEAGGLIGRLERAILRHRDPRGTSIDDWRWRPLRQVRDDLGDLQAVPPHVEDFGRQMTETADRAAVEGLTARDLLKAYTLTRASIQRQARDADKVRAAGLELPPDASGKIRPEGAWAEWLLSPMGQRYLDQAERGIADPAAVRSAMQIMTPFGKAETDIPNAMTWAAANLPGREGAFSDLVARGRTGDSSPQEWRGATADLRGIKSAKAGFFASLLGRGDQPTLDARQIILQTGEPTYESKNFLKRVRGGADAVDRLSRRQSALDLDLPSDLEPFRQHLTHHTVWDRVANETTTHEDVLRALRLGGAAGLALPLAGLDDEEPRADGGRVGVVDPTVPRPQGGAVHHRNMAAGGIVSADDPIAAAEVRGGLAAVGMQGIAARLVDDRVSP
jgi:hypothetical protein